MVQMQLSFMYRELKNFVEFKMVGILNRTPSDICVMLLVNIVFKSAEKQQQQT